MENPKHSTKQYLAIIMSLFKSGQSVENISKIVGYAGRTVQKWVKWFKDGGAKKVPEHGKTFWETKNDHSSKQVEANPQISAGEIKLNNPQLLIHVSRRTTDKVIATRLTCQQVRYRVVFCQKYCEWWYQIMKSGQRISGNQTPDPRLSCLNADHYTTASTKKGKTFTWEVLAVSGESLSLCQCRASQQSLPRPWTEAGRLGEWIERNNTSCCHDGSNSEDIIMDPLYRLQIMVSKDWLSPPAGHLQNIWRPC